ncbi:unnamed protein product [Ambrosiozyma monospora]|uniref:Unnamed protein product n=1 Tax=Ambrosiozyma monospora TaxID=43982 RepID=A0ACB5UEP2_AMBMO|nr:unnamed protein product [Ambrosiozyma monospora]
MGKKHFKMMAFRNNDLSTIKLKLIWEKTDPKSTVEPELKFIPPPMATQELLLQGSSKYGEHIASWCEVKLGSKVGDGECWTLAHDALEKSCGKHAFVSSGYCHGAILYTLIGSEKKGVPPSVVKESVTDELKRGDILQFTSCGFRYPNKALFFGDPNHTSEAAEVKPSPDNSQFQKVVVLHQNVNGHKIVSTEEIELDKLMEGKLEVYRPVDASWIPSLEDSLLSL